MRKSTVVVVGAGPSGLVVAKELLQEGHTVTCFEQAQTLGGVFRYRPHPDAIGVWESCRLTSSMLVTSFSDFFPHRDGAPPYEHRHFAHYEYVKYLEAYAQHFGVLRRIRFRCEVVDVVPTQSGRWQVTVKDHAVDREEVQEFDAVAICSGVHRVPCIPRFPGIETFSGQILHAANYKCPASLRGRTALFVGAGESGGDIIGEATGTLERCYLSLRRGVFVIPRLLNRLPNDYAGTRLLYSLPEFVSRRTDPEVQVLKRRLGLAVAPLSLLGNLLVWARNRLVALFAGHKGRVDPRSDQIETTIMQLRAQAGGNQFETFATKTESFVEAIVDGKCELRPGIERITPTGAVFVDGTAVDVDSIVLCTGFEKPTVQFLRAMVELERLYKSCFDPAFGKTLAFIGFIRPSIGAIPPMSELQARWLAQLLSGNLELPDPESMRSETAQELAKRERYYRQIFRRLPYIVDFSTYMDGLAEIIGCKPRLADFLLQPRLLYKLHVGAFCGAHYRFRGPHAQPELAARVVLHSSSHGRWARFLQLALAEGARLAGLTRLQPHLSLVGKIRDRSKSWVA